jgi:predicted Zn-dependent protease
MIGRERIFEALLKTVRNAKSEATAVCLGSFSGLTRYANNQIHQNLHTQDVQVWVRAKLGKRFGVATCNGLDPETLDDTLKRAEAIAEATPEIPDLPPLAGMRAYRPFRTFIPETAAATPERRAKDVKTICDMAKSAGASASGLFESGYNELAVVNNIGMRSYAQTTKAELMAIMGDGVASGYGNGLSRNIEDIDVEKVGQRALEKFEADKNRKTIEPGDYEVVLEPAAVSEALRWLVYIGFTSKTIDDGTSFLAGRKGEQIMQPEITIMDDAYEQNALGVPFDFEGMPKVPVHLIRDGVVKTGVHDTQSAVRNKTFSTGHAAPFDLAAEGAVPMNLVMAPGDAKMQDMIGSVERGILVTRFHYINGFIDTRKGVLTGMTRDGTFLIEDGKITGGLPNMRFMQSFVEAFNNVKAISAERRSNPSWWRDGGAFYMPALQINDFRFIGVQKEE